MAVKIIIFALAALVCQVYSQSQCGCGPILRPPLITPPVVATSPVTTTSPAVITEGPVTTIIDNSVSNSLANAIQLLIVSKLIESTVNANIVSPVTPLQNPIYPIDATISPVFTSPVPEIPSYGNSGVIQAVYSVPEITAIQNPVGVPEILTPNALPGPFNDGVGSGSVLSYPLDVNPYAPVVGGVDSIVPIVGPFAADVLFPSSIPVQLICDFGYTPSNIPIVNYNVEPISFGNGLFY